MKRILCILAGVILVFSTNIKALACSLYYIGGAFTDDKANLFVRVEDGENNDQVSLYRVSPAGKYKAGEEYHGCYGFVWNFTHDNYRYVSRSDTNFLDECPVCGEVHDSLFYEEAGTNERGLSMTATQSLDPNPQIKNQDPFEDTGISEAEITTLILSECASAREAVYFLKDIVEKYGIYDEGFGIMLCDQKEQWYVEAIAGHYVLAVLLPKTVSFFQANVSVLGRIDLDDTENVIASDGLIELAQKAGTFVGDAENNIIDYRVSINDYCVEAVPEITDEQMDVWRQNVETRIALSYNYLTGTEDYQADRRVLENNGFVMSNVTEDGSIVSLYNGIKPSQTVSLDYLFKMLDIYPIGYSENVETHLYRFYPEAETELGTVEWSAMDNNRFSVFVPGYPMLLTDTWEGYQKIIPETQLVTEKPDTKDCYEMHGVYYLEYYIKDWSGIWHVFPDGWEDSYIATFSALSNYLTYSDPKEGEVELTDKCFDGLQQDFESRFKDITAAIKEKKELSEREEIMTKEHNEMSKEAQTLALALYRKFVYGEDSDVINNAEKLGKQSDNKRTVVVLMIAVVLALALAGAIGIYRKRSAK